MTVHVPTRSPSGEPEKQFSAETMTTAELHAEHVRLCQEAVEAAQRSVEAHQRWVDAEATYARYAPWLIAFAGGCFIVGFLL